MSNWMHRQITAEARACDKINKAKGCAVKEIAFYPTAEEIINIYNRVKTRHTLPVRVAPHPAVIGWEICPEREAVALPVSNEMRRMFITTFPSKPVPSPFGKPGDLLWVKEAWSTRPELNDVPAHALKKDTECFYAHGPRTFQPGHKIRQPRQMPRFLCRALLRVKEVWIARLHTIAADGRVAKEVLAEGLPRAHIARASEFVHPDDAPGFAFGNAWAKKHRSPFTWGANPFCWMCRFELQDIDIIDGKGTIRVIKNLRADRIRPF